MSEEAPIVLTVDVEDWYHLPPITGAPDSMFGTVEQFFEEWDDEYDRLSIPTKRTLDLLDELDIRATFFVVADIVDKYEGLVKLIAERGHDIACHGLHHACAIDPKTKEARFDPDTYRQRLETARSKLRAASGQRITGFRAPNGYVADWMLDILDELGCVYDSSVAKNSLYNKTNSSLHGVSTVPYRPKTGTLEPGGDRSLIELPWSHLKVRGLEIPTGGGPLARLMPNRLLQAGLQQSLDRGPAMFYFHPLDICQESFPVYGGALQRLFWHRGGRPIEKKIRSLLQSIDADRIVSCDELFREIDGSELAIEEKTEVSQMSNGETNDMIAKKSTSNSQEVKR